MLTERQIVDAYTERALRLIRVGHGLGDDAVAELRALADELRREIAGHDLAALNRRDLEVLLREVAERIDARYTAITESARASLAALLAREAAWATKASELRRSAGATALAAAVAGLTVLGLPVARHWGRQAANLRDRIAAIVRNARATDQPARDMLPELFGRGPRGRERGGAFERARTQAQTLAATATSEAAYAGRLAVWRAGGITALRWHAILDSRTTLGCAVRAGRMYDLDLKPINHDVPVGTPPPAHWNCRSILVPLQWPGEFPRGGHDPFAESLDQWLERQPPKLQDELLGPVRAKLWRTGKVDARGLLGPGGQPLPVSELP